MSDFDWDAQESADDFDWNSQENAEKAPVAETAIMQGLQGASGGFLDELSGAGEAAGRVVGIEGLGGSFSDVGLAKGGPTLKMDVLKQAYENSRNRKREMLAKQSRDNPATATIAGLGGAIVSPLNKAVKGLSLARGGAVLGGVNAMGASEAEDLGGLGMDTLVGAGLGGAVGKAVDKASPLIERGVKRVSDGAGDLAERLSARALGAERGTIKSLGMDKVKAAGRQALDENVLSPFGSTDDIVARNASVKDRGGKMMGEAYNAIDDAGASTFNPREVAEIVDDKLAPTWRTPLNKGETNQFENTLETILERGPGDIPLREAQLLKQELQSAANWKNTLNPTAKEQMARDAYRVVSEQIDEAVNLGQNAVNKAGLAETLSRGKDLFAKGSTTDKLLQNKVAREQGNKLFGLTDTITGGAALGYGYGNDDWAGAAGIFGAKKYLGKYGAQQGALVLDKVSKTLMQTPRFAQMATNNPKAFNAMAMSMAKRLEGSMPKAAQFDPQKPQDDKEARDAFLDQ